MGGMMGMRESLLGARRARWGRAGDRPARPPTLPSSSS